MIEDDDENAPKGLVPHLHYLRDHYGIATAGKAADEIQRLRAVIHAAFLDLCWYRGDHGADKQDLQGIIDDLAIALVDPESND